MYKKFILLTLLSLSLLSCQAFKPKKVDTRETPTNAQERARKNIEEGRGSSIGGLLGVGRGTNYEFSTSNPMWRATLEILGLYEIGVKGEDEAEDFKKSNN